ncbi:GLTP-domain-containing protein [Tilletiaria anomala UBC 951]|uniref:GLTP-domain-containing protein n=1 Tax=Tilletiaria anomala (strain ATCC 24038 / CBS 436.72 / UBC 951) TaxID=1037660 RepID=A0A066WDQ3_TILAU|nr:GLTP-domain-containing protein [Tilletiaria anomala UBC 951]KDN48875.1 GLTP-domain-containing protein [Tilletiaria anomala UBC 951]
MGHWCALDAYIPTILQRKHHHQIAPCKETSRQVKEHHSQERIDGRLYRRNKMSTYFDTIKKSYADVPIEAGVDTSAFLEATEGLVNLLGLLGSAAFSVVQNDMNGNLKKIRERLLTAPTQSATLEQLIENEGKPGEAAKKRPASEGLMWLLRGLDFTAQALRRSISDKSEQLSASFTKAYESSLQQHHSFVIRPVFSLAMKACPYRQDFYTKLGNPPAKVEEELEHWLQGLEKIVKQLQNFYVKGGWAKGF